MMIVGRQAGQRDVDQLVPFGSTVNGGGLVERGVDAGQCRHVRRTEP